MSLTSIVFITTLVASVWLFGPAQKEATNVAPALAAQDDILLRYVYARKAKDGWAFFDRAYRRSDKREIKARIRSVLKRAPVYR